MSDYPVVTVEVDAATSGPVSQWTAYLEHKGSLKIIEGDVKDQSTYTSEVLEGMIRALRALKKPCNVTIYTSCRHTVDSANGWVYGWAKKKWLTSNGGEVKNSHYWEEFLELKQMHHIEVHLDKPATERIRVDCGVKVQKRWLELKKISAI